MKGKIAKWYEWGLWTKEMVLNAVRRKILTGDEASEILALHESKSELP